MRKLLSFLFILLLSVQVMATTSRTGYSGAPGSRGTCASSCHGVSGGTLVLVGFPTTYVPGQVYQLTL